MKKFFQEYGMLALAAIVIVMLVGMASPVGAEMKDQTLKLTNSVNNVNERNNVDGEETADGINSISGKPATRKLTYVLDGGSISGNTNVEYEMFSEVELLKPTKNKWNFVGYNSKPDGSGMYYDSKIVMDENKVVYAIYNTTVYRTATVKKWSNDIVSEKPVNEPYNEIVLYGYQEAESFSQETVTQPASGYYMMLEGENAVCGTTEYCAKTGKKDYSACNDDCPAGTSCAASPCGIRQCHCIGKVSVCVEKGYNLNSCTYYKPVNTWKNEQWAKTIDENTPFTEINGNENNPRKAISKTGYQKASEFNKFSEWQIDKIIQTANNKVESKIIYNYEY